MDGELLNWIVMFVAGFLGGALNAVAGGGSFITLPALVFAGLPPVAANATGTAALLPGYVASAWRFRKDIQFPAALEPMSVILVAVFGGGIGAGILLLTNEALFAQLIPWLIFLATCAFAIGPWLINRNGAQSEAGSGRLKTVLVLLAVCVYGGYFNGGLGIILLAAFGVLGQTGLHGMNGLKNLISALLTVVAVVVYGLGGVIYATPLLVVGAGALTGGYFGAVLAYKIKPGLMRVFIIVVGLMMALLFLLK